MENTINTCAVNGKSHLYRQSKRRTRLHFKLIRPVLVQKDVPYPRRYKLGLNGALLKWRIYLN